MAQSDTQTRVAMQKSTLEIRIFGGKWSPISYPTECVGKSKGYMLRLVTLFLHFPTSFLIFQRDQIQRFHSDWPVRAAAALSRSASDVMIDVATSS